MNLLRGWWTGLMVASALVLAGCAGAPKAESAAAGHAAPTAQAWVRTELYFSLGDWTETALNTDAELRWAKFLDAEVTPRFPAGLSVADVYGQWRDGRPGAAVSRERSRLLIILHPATAANSSRIDEIREAWKRATGEKSVLRVTQPAEVGF